MICELTKDDNNWILGGEIVSNLSLDEVWKWFSITEGLQEWFNQLSIY